MREKSSDLKYYNDKCEIFEKENAVLKSNKWSNIEINDKVKELHQENFILHEKNNELLDKLERLTQENLNYDKKVKKLEDKIEGERNMDNMLKTGNFGSSNAAATVKFGGGAQENYESLSTFNNKEKVRFNASTTQNFGNMEEDKGDHGLKLYNMMFIDKVRY